MKHTIVYILLLLSVLAHGQNKKYYAKPIDTELRVSGSFAEMRDNHFHSGVDFTTSGSVGLKVFSAEDGYVSRVKVSAYGYGHALYISHPDGNTTVYGHLNAYADHIDSLVRREQMRRKSFEVDWFPQENQIPVKRGEVVGFSGNTGGSGGPHLHFEVRSSQSEEPMNPLAFVAPIADTLAPTVFGVKLYAAQPTSQILGKCADRYFALADISGKTINAIGRVTCGVHVTDYFLQGGRPCGIVEARLFARGKQIFTAKLDRFSFDDTQYINSHIDFAERKTNKRFIQKSFVDPGNKLKLYTGTGEIDIAEGEDVAVRYELLDFVGNCTTINFVLHGKAVQNVSRKKPEGKLADWQRTWSIDTLGATIIVPHGALYRNEYLTVTKKFSRQLGADVLSVGPNTIPLQKAMTITLPLPEKFEKVADKSFIALVNNRGVLSYNRSTFANGKITAKPNQMGDFVVACDTVAPKLSSRNTRSTLQPQHFVMVGISDNLSGVATYSCYIDGEWQVFEYDYKKTMLKANVRKLGLPKGKHKLVATATDSCGNTSRFEWIFTTE